MKSIVLQLAFLFSVVRAVGEVDDQRLVIHHLTKQFFVYTTYNTYEGTKTPAHGMYLVTDSGVVLFDTPWDTTQFEPLLDSIMQRHHQPVILCLATHWHRDRTAGLSYYKQRGIKTFTSKLTDDLCREKDMKRAAYTFRGDTLFKVGADSFETYYPGPGHTLDNIVLWFGGERILYGGCLIKGAKAKNLGYLGDGDVMAYERTLNNVYMRYPHPKFIIVSHHDWHSTQSLRHSIFMARKLRRK